LDTKGTPRREIPKKPSFFFLCALGTRKKTARPLRENMADSVVILFPSAFVTLIQSDSGRETAPVMLQFQSITRPPIMLTATHGMVRALQLGDVMKHTRVSIALTGGQQGYRAKTQESSWSKLRETGARGSEK
jgi:hypothetical protein